MKGYQCGGEKERVGGKGTGNKKHNWRAQNRQGEVKNSIGNGESKELICIIYEHELSGGGQWWNIGRREFRAEWIKGRKN